MQADQPVAASLLTNARPATSKAETAAVACCDEHGETPRRLCGRHVH